MVLLHTFLKIISGDALCYWTSVKSFSFYEVSSRTSLIPWSMIFMPSCSVDPSTAGTKTHPTPQHFLGFSAYPNGKKSAPKCTKHPRDPRRKLRPEGPGTLNSSEKTKVKGRPAESNCDTHTEEGVSGSTSDVFVGGLKPRKKTWVSFFLGCINDASSSSSSSAA